MTEPASGGKPAGDRRGPDRRDQRDRRDRSDRRVGEGLQPPWGRSWFGALDGALDGGAEVARDAKDAENFAPLSSTQAQASQQTSAADGAGQGAVFAGENQPAVPPGQTAYQRIFRTFLGARAALAVVLTASMGLAFALQSSPSVIVMMITLAYGVQAVGLWLLALGRDRLDDGGLGLARLRGRAWVATVGVDIVCYLSLHALTSTTFFNHIPLLVLPVLMAGVLTPRLMALATAAAVGLGLLLVAWFDASVGVGSTLLLSQAGLAGSGFFVITILAGELAGRIAREERSARGSLELARRQAQLNHLMIEEMQDGVLVVDRLGRVRAANPAARRLLSPAGLCPPAPFNLGAMPAWQSVVRAVEQAFATGTWPEAGSDVTLRFGSASLRVLRMRVRFTRDQADQAGEDFCVLLLEDVRSMQARSRQEKLAAMGRMSAGIAHEIRNPLAAISQANALLAEDAVTPTQHQLTRLVSDNVHRLKRIIDDVLEAAPVGPQAAAVIHVGSVVQATCSEWMQAQGLVPGESCALQLDVPQEAWGAAFDTDHLRRVLVNLLDNALRHCTRTPGSVRLRLYSPSSERLIISVASDGAPIDADVEPYLFEPFFSTRSRGTGLGLYICKELCERYGARIAYRLCTSDMPHRNEFILGIPRQPLGAHEA